MGPSRGAGGTFCAGDDITEMPRWGNANDIMRRVTGYQHMADTLEELDTITIAGVDGYAVGGGVWRSPWPATSSLLQRRRSGECPKLTWASPRGGAAQPGWHV